MAEPFRHQPQPPRWLRRLDRAAARINPLLAVLAIGLAVLDVTFLFLRLSTLPIMHLPGYPAGANGIAAVEFRPPAPD